MKKVIIINGSGGCGKDTFVSFVSEFIPTRNYSSIDLIKSVAKRLGWDGGKTEKDRKFLSDLKQLSSEYNNAPLNDMKKVYNEFMSNNTEELLFLHIREPEEIEIAKNLFDAEILLIKNPNIKNIDSNEADRNVYSYSYDHVIYNDGTLEDLDTKAENFVDMIYENEILSKQDRYVSQKLQEITEESYLFMLKTINFDPSKFVKCIKHTYEYNQFFVTDNLFIVNSNDNINTELKKLVELKLMEENNEDLKDKTIYRLTDFGLRYIQGREHVKIYKTSMLM